MAIEDVYKTIVQPSKGIFKAKGSKFLAFAYPISSVDEVKQHLDTLRKEYFDARHHCYAYAIGINREHYRTNDDGEPSGTAGKPIYNQILSSNLTNILIVVVRYFGGTLLGTSGLINAYKSASVDSIKNAEITEKTDCELITIRFDYVLLNDLYKILRTKGIEIKKQDLNSICEFDIEIRKTLFEQTLVKLGKINKIEIISKK
jgi:uncharacterized YigZ family protein